MTFLAADSVRIRKVRKYVATLVLVAIGSVALLVAIGSVALLVALLAMLW